MSQSKESPKRRYIRFEPDEVVIGQVQFIDASPDDAFFKADVAGPVIDESYEGCALVALQSGLPEAAYQDAPCLVKLNRLGPMRAELRWIKPLDEDVCKIGLHYVAE